MRDFNIDNLMLSSYGEYFNAETFLQKVKGIAKKAGSEVVYQALLLYSILIEERVPFRMKILIGGALGYLLLPMDLVPDFILGLGFADDLTAISFVLTQIAEYRTEDIENNAKSLFEDIFGVPYDEL